MRQAHIHYSGKHWWNLPYTVSEGPGHSINDDKPCVPIGVRATFWRARQLQRRYGTPEIPHWRDPIVG